MEYILNEIKKLQKDMERYRSSEFSKVVPLTDRVRVLNDATPRAAVFNQSVTVAGSGTLPAYMTAVWYQVVFTATGAGNNVLNIICPDSALNVTGIAGTPGTGNVMAGGGFVKLGAQSGANAGKINVNLTVGGYNQLIIDIVAYLL